MIHAVEHALGLLQAAAEARRLYAQDHPTARQRAEAARAALGRLAADHPDAIALLLDDRVVVGDESLASGKALAVDAFGSLRRRGVAAFRFHAAPSEADLDAIIHCLLTPGDPLPDCQSVLLCTSGSSPAPAGTRSPAAAIPEHAAPTVKGVLESLAGGTPPDLASLSELVAELVALIDAQGSALVPLAQLRSHDEYTYVHTLNVAMLSGALAQAAGLPPDRVRDTTCAAMLHDVGKILTPLELLNKGGKLSDEELRVIRRHPVDGARILLVARVELDVGVAVAYEHHMHRSGGGGYPKFPPGWRMHAASQIVQVADIFDALRTNRPYRPALSIEKAREIMYKDVGKIFEQPLLDLFFARVAGRTTRDAA